MAGNRENIETFSFHLADGVKFKKHFTKQWPEIELRETVIPPYTDCSDILQLEAGQLDSVWCCRVTMT